MKKKLDFIMRGGLTKRYHTVDTIHGQNVAEHSFGVAMLMMLMYDPAGEGGWATPHALLHDLAEAQVGDISSPVKRAMPELKVFLDKAEYLAFQEAGITLAKLSPRQHRMLKMADNMEGMLFCCRERYKGNKNIIEVYENFKSYTLALEPQGKELELFTLIQEYYYEAVKHSAR